MLRFELDGLRLHHLAEVDESREVLWLAVVAAKIDEQPVVAVSVRKLLVRAHHRRIQRLLLRRCEGPDGAHIWESFESVLGDEARRVLQVIFDWRGARPHVPRVHVAVVIVVRLRLMIRTRRTGPVGDLGIVNRNRALQNVVEQQHHTGLDLRALDRRDVLLQGRPVGPCIPSRLDFVVAAPQSQAGMIAQPVDLFDRFLLHIRAKLRIVRRNGASKHEVLPHHQAEPVAFIVKIIALVVAAAPQPHHVHVCIAC